MGSLREIKETCYKGTRIIIGGEKNKKLQSCIRILEESGFQLVQLPIIQKAELFKNKVGKENNNLMYNFTDRGNRNLCLAPEYTAIFQELAKTTFKQDKTVKLFYIQECFRGEKPQAGRYRQFTQLGVEVLNCKGKPQKWIHALAVELTRILNPNLKIKIDYRVSRGLDYYKDGKGFEIIAPELGSSKQVCGGGEYEEGYGFAIGVDRLIKTE